MNKRKKILHANLNNQGGAFSLIYQAQIELQDKYVFDYFSANEYVNNEIYENLLEMGSKCVGGINCGSRLLKQYKIYKALKEYLLKNQYDYVHIHADTAWKMSIYFFACKSAKVKNIVVHSHSSGVAGHFRIINYLLHLVMRPIVKSAKYKCACSKVAADWMYKTEEGVLFIQNGVDVNKYKFNSNDRKRIRKQYGVEDEQVIIGTVGDFSYPKNPNFIKRIITKLDGEQYRFLLVGDGAGKQKLEREIIQGNCQDKVIFTGAIPSTEAYLSAMDVFILPSRFEGLPICALESQINGVYTIVSENVTPETKCSKYFERIELNVQKWVEYIRGLELSYDRDRQETYLVSMKMNIKETARQLDILYGQDG